MIQNINSDPDMIVFGHVTHIDTCSHWTQHAPAISLPVIEGK